MKTSVVQGKIVGCIGKCSSGLTTQELDRITDSVQKTLTNDKGRKIFYEYLKRSNNVDAMNCLNFYEKCCIVLEKENNYHLMTKNPDLKIFTEDFNDIFDTAAELNGVPEIDLAILERFNECLTTPCRDSMINVIEDTKMRLAEHLKISFKHFKIYMLEPCPKTK
ncbi:uncharacterized protein LOC122849615 [Aphidius gifuensis]|nr:uncharacterized protein LOC122849615 [Aphidius gifuensis]